MEETTEKQLIGNDAGVDDRANRMIARMMDEPMIEDARRIMMDLKVQLYTDLDLVRCVFEKLKDVNKNLAAKLLSTKENAKELANEIDQWYIDIMEPVREHMEEDLLEVKLVPVVDRVNPVWKRVNWKIEQMGFNNLQADFQKELNDIDKVTDQARKNFAKLIDDLVKRSKEEHTSLIAINKDTYLSKQCTCAILGLNRNGYEKTREGTLAGVPKNIDYCVLPGILKELDLLVIRNYAIRALRRIKKSRWTTIITEGLCEQALLNYFARCPKITKSDGNTGPSTKSDGNNSTTSENSIGSTHDKGGEKDALEENHAGEKDIDDEEEDDTSIGSTNDIDDTGEKALDEKHTGEKDNDDEEEDDTSIGSTNDIDDTGEKDNDDVEGDDTSEISNGSKHDTAGEHNDCEEEDDMSYISVGSDDEAKDNMDEDKNKTSSIAKNTLCLAGGGRQLVERKEGRERATGMKQIIICWEGNVTRKYRNCLASVIWDPKLYIHHI